MQELRSTEILDKEIQEDAQKKVIKILQNAESEYKQIVGSVDEKLSGVLQEKDDFYNKKLEAFENNLRASIPLEKSRFEVSYVQNLILKNIDEYLKNLTEEKRIQLVTKKLSDKKISEMLDQKQFNAYVYGFDIKKAEKELSAKLGKKLLKCESTEFGKLVLEDENVQLKEGIILEADDKAFRIRLTLSEIIGQLLDKNRAELSKALLGI